MNDTGLRLTTQFTPRELTVQQVLAWGHAVMTQASPPHLVCLTTLGDGYLHLLMAASCGIEPDALNALTISQFTALWERVKAENPAFFASRAVEGMLNQSLERISRLSTTAS